MTMREEVLPLPSSTNPEKRLSVPLILSPNFFGAGFGT
jgi:hypothetical protein